MNLNEKRIWLFGVANACPLNVPEKSCPFKDIRNKSVAERWAYYSGLPEDQVESMINHHLECLYNREMKKHGGKTN